MAAKHYFRHQNWKQQNPGKQPRKLRSIQAWVGKVIPCDVDPACFDEVNQCDLCGCYCEDWHGFLYPQSPADWQLLKALHADIAEGYCEKCLDALREEADEIAPGWYERHLEALDAAA